MSLGARIAKLEMAKADCSRSSKRTADAWSRLKQEGELAATPRRVVATGLAAGFVAGLGGGSKKRGSAIAGKLIDLLMDGVFANLGAAIAAGAAAAEAEAGEGQSATAGAARTGTGG
ncbi:MAG TPA: hypothetical protein VK753_01290 [Xanthomonadaceae bacterium]|jgi:hypothetical protein|nr:hypothetical protein [Xanthomonadaceae bacterium]